MTNTTMTSIGEIGPIDFYPTPPALVTRMLDLVDWRYVSNVLEPWFSIGGKGGDRA